MEAALCDSPENMMHQGPDTIRKFRAFENGVVLPPQHKAALSALLRCYEASLFRALDYHDFMDLQSHHICSQRTVALLLSIKTMLPQPMKDELTAVVEAIANCDGRCVVAGIETAPPQPSQRAWFQRVLGAVDKLSPDHLPAERSIPSA